MPASSPLTPSPRPGLFRIHTGGLDAPLERESGGIFVQLSQEWIRLAALPSMPRTLRRWGQAEPPLAGLVSLGDLVDRIDLAQGGVEDELLLALVRRCSAGAACPAQGSRRAGSGVDAPGPSTPHRRGSRRRRRRATLGTLAVTAA